MHEKTNVFLKAPPNQTRRLLVEYMPVRKSCHLLVRLAALVPVIDAELAVVGARWDLMEQNMLKVLL